MRGALRVWRGQEADSPFPVSAVASLRPGLGPGARGAPAAARVAAGVRPAERARRSPGRRGPGTPATPAAGRGRRGPRASPPPPPPPPPGLPARRATSAALRRRRRARALAVLAPRGRRGFGVGRRFVAGPGRGRAGLLTGREGKRGHGGAERETQRQRWGGMRRGEGQRGGQEEKVRAQGGSQRSREGDAGDRSRDRAEVGGDRAGGRGRGRKGKRAFTGPRPRAASPGASHTRFPAPALPLPLLSVHLLALDSAAHARSQHAKHKRDGAVGGCRGGGSRTGTGASIAPPLAWDGRFPAERRERGGTGRPGQGQPTRPGAPPPAQGDWAEGMEGGHTAHR